MSLARGRRWEAAAGEYLQRQGLAILARGYRCRLGELDLVCRDAGTLVIVEVRARAAGSAASAVESISAHKRARIVQAPKGKS